MKLIAWTMQVHGCGNVSSKVLHERRDIDA